MFNYCTFCKLTLRKNTRHCCRNTKYSVMHIESQPDYLSMMKDKSFDTPVIKFYEGRSVFITGVTGFLGGVLLEKLLFACPKIKSIYVLIRESSKKTGEERFQQFLDSQLFERVNENNKGSIKNKIIPVFGNVTQKRLGLNDTQVKAIQEEVSIVFHCAASTNFNNDLAKSIKINTHGTEEIIKLSKKIKKLTTFVFVSSAYSNTERTFINETIYRKSIGTKAMYHVVDELQLNNNLLKSLLEGKPNTYTLSKALSEECVADEMINIPTVIVRPSIIISSAEEPLKGWSSGWSGTNVLAAAVCRGHLRSLKAKPAVTIDLIPVDYVANLLVVSAWDATVNRSESGSKLKIFNCCSSLQNPIKFSDFFHTCLFYGKKHFPGGIVPKTLLVYKCFIMDFLVWFFLQLIPAFFADTFSLLTGGKPRMMNIQYNLWSVTSVLQHFSLNYFIFIDYNVKDLYEKLDEKDKRIFNFNVKNITWECVIENYVIGLKKYLLKET